jgi:hypothetical protein
VKKPKPAHLQAQDAVVRMLFDPAFAQAVRTSPDKALPDLPEPLRTQLATIDPRALKMDRLRGRRLLRTLFDEYKASTTLVLAREKRMSFLDEFFSSVWFEHALDGPPVALAYGGYLTLHHPDLSGVVSIERAIARARRPLPLPSDGQVWVAPGVAPVTVATQGDLAALQQAEQYLFEVGLMPAVALCDDAPPLVLDERTRDKTRVYLVAITTEAGQSLVTVDEALHRQLQELPQPYRPELQPLIDDEIAVRT